MTGSDLPEVDLAAVFGPLVHPTKIQIIEAMRWIGRPLSASELVHVFDEKTGLASVSYHLTALRKLHVMDRVGKERVRGAWKTHHFFRGVKPAECAGD
jgi:DNA-binding transcriptional ArsR family regulator